MNKLRILKSRFASFVLLAVALVAMPAILFLSGCDGDNIETIFVERPFFEDPPEAAAGFLGYDTIGENAEVAEENLTVCGNCHIGQQAQWELNAHAEAWESLQASGHAQAFCENCHTVGPLGNPAENGGWATTQDERYHDVQCESCHGPGATHVENPDASQPVASLALGDVTNLENATGCASCHQGTHHPFVEEWSQSRHAVVSFAAARPECAGCHSGQGALRAWGVKANYVEKESSEPLAIVCGVCHDPHDATFEGQLRLPVQTNSLEEHLCAQCHDRRTVPDPNSSHGLEPHAPEASLLLGEAGWFPPGATIEQGRIIGTHGSTANEALCATCHVSSFTVTDDETGDFVLNATGHLFNAIPCLNEEGIPTTDDDCALTAEARSFDGCTASGCHGTTQAAASALTVATDRLRARAEELLELLEQVDPGLDAEGGEIDAANPTFTVAEGAFFNYHLAEFGGETTGAAAHNPFLTEALLIASIQAVEETYGLQANTRVDYDAEMERLLNKIPQNITPIRRAGAPLRR